MTGCWMSRGWGGERGREDGRGRTPLAPPPQPTNPQSELTQLLRVALATTLPPEAESLSGNRAPPHELDRVLVVLSIGFWRVLVSWSGLVGC